MKGKNLGVALVAMVMLWTLAVPAVAVEKKQEATAVIGGLENNQWMTKYGNVFCDLEAEVFAAQGFAWGDLVRVTFLDQSLSLPVVPTYFYVDSGLPAIIMGQNEAGAPEGALSLAINMGNFAQTYGLAVKKTDADGNWWFEAGEGVTFPVEVHFEMDVPAGYRTEYLLRDLSRTNAREDYAHLTDAQFANFREIALSGLKAGILYRSSSPVNPEMERNGYADAALCAAKVKTILNLADSREAAAAYAGYADTYYAQQQIIFLNLGVDFAAADFQQGLAAGLRYMAAHEGPYLVHCTEGKDRAGFVSALLACFAGASYGEVLTDYMVTYSNYYGVEPGSDQYDAIAESNIIKSLKLAFGVEDLSAVDLQKEAREYMRMIGLTADEIDALAAHLLAAKDGD